VRAVAGWLPCPGSGLVVTIWLTSLTSLTSLTLVFANSGHFFAAVQAQEGGGAGVGAGRGEAITAGVAQDGRWRQDLGRSGGAAERGGRRQQLGRGGSSGAAAAAAAGGQA
jgi:hypothetical protein